MALLSQREYARYRKERGYEGITATAVQRALESKRISYAPETKLIDPEKADADWAANTEPRPKGSSKPFTKEKRKKQETAPSDTDYNLSRAKREFYDSEFARLKFEEKQGTLVPGSIVRKVLYEAGRIVGAGLDNIVSQLAPDLASETAIAAVEHILKVSFDKLRTEMADKVDKLDELLVDEAEESEDE